MASLEETDMDIEKLMLNVKATEKLIRKKLHAIVLVVEILPNEVAQYSRVKAKELGAILALGKEYTR